MSIQSTIILNRKEAEERLIKKRAQEEIDRKRKSDVYNLTNEEIENELDEQFYNYIIE